MITNRTGAHYDAVMSKAVTDFKACDFWKSLLSSLTEIDQEYRLKTNYILRLHESPPEVLIKPFKSFLLKTFRKNVLNNGKWPAPPDSGWLLPENWFSQINDTVRTSFVVKYLDGVNFLAEKCTEQATAAKHDSRVDFEAKDEGYYAAHFYVLVPCNVPRENWDTESLTISVEIQITTQLQEVIKRLLHKHYEQYREKSPTPNTKWQWDYKSDEFAANYLGHILHYVEGMIMDVRDK